MSKQENKPKTVNVPEAQLLELLNQNDIYKKDIEEFKAITLGIVTVLGLTENGKLKQSIISGEESAMKVIVKGLSGTVTNMMINPKQVEKDFDFVVKIVPLLERHS